MEQSSPTFVLREIGPETFFKGGFPTHQKAHTYRMRKELAFRKAGTPRYFVVEEER